MSSEFIIGLVLGIALGVIGLIIFGLRHFETEAQETVLHCIRRTSTKVIIQELDSEGNYYEEEYTKDPGFLSGFKPSSLTARQVRYVDVPVIKIPKHVKDRKRSTIGKFFGGGEDLHKET